MSNENAWRKSDGFEFVTIKNCIHRERKWNKKLSTDVIFIALEAQTDPLIMYIVKINNMIWPIWNEIRKAVFYNRMVYFERRPMIF